MQTRILAIETSGPLFSLALLEDGRVIDSFHSTEKMAHEAGAAIALDHLMKRNQLEFKNLGLIAAGSGPGSYSGLRIGMALASGISLASGVPVLGIGTLDNIAAQLKTKSPESDYYLVLVPARKEEYFMALWPRESEEPIIPPGWIHEEDAVSGLNNLPHDARITTNHSSALLLTPKLLPDNIRIHEVSPDAETVASLAFYRLKTGNLPDADSPEPDYLKPVYISGNK